MIDLTLVSAKRHTANEQLLSTTSGAFFRSGFNAQCESQRVDEVESKGRYARDVLVKGSDDKRERGVWTMRIRKRTRKVGFANLRDCKNTTTRKGEYDRTERNCRYRKDRER